MNVGDLMTTTVIGVDPDTPLKDAAEILAKNQISGMPVVDARGVVTGVLSAEDIVHRESAGERPSGPVVPKLLATTVGGATSSPAVTIGPRQPVTDAVRTMVDERVGRLPVVDGEGRLVGIVTRTDLVRVFVRPDEDVAEEIRTQVLRRLLRHDADNVHIDVERGEVTLTGMIETQTDAEAVPILVRRVPGVVSVVSRLGWLDQNGRLDGKPVEPSGGEPSDSLPTFLQEHRRAVLTAAGNALARQPMPHYSWDGDEAALRRLSALFEQLLCALDSHDLGPIVAYAERVAEERFSAGYDLSEVQVAFNALEETTWSCVLAELDASRFAEAISLISTAIGAVKDALARRYVSLATGTRVPSLDVRVLFGGSVEGIHAGQRRTTPDPARPKEEGER
jgi:CBS domain-containing protein